MLHELRSTTTLVKLVKLFLLLFLIYSWVTRSTALQSLIMTKLNKIGYRPNQLMQIPQATNIVIAVT